MISPVPPCLTADCSPFVFHPSVPCRAVRVTKKWGKKKKKKKKKKNNNNKGPFIFIWSKRQELRPPPTRHVGPVLSCALQKGLNRKGWHFLSPAPPPLWCGSPFLFLPILSLSLDHQLLISHTHTFFFLSFSNSHPTRIIIRNIFNSAAVKNHPWWMHLM